MSWSHSRLKVWGGEGTHLHDIVYLLHLGLLQLGVGKCKQILLVGEASGAAKQAAQCIARRRGQGPDWPPEGWHI